MKLHQIIAVLNEWAPPELQESYDNAKLITGDSNWEISKAIATLDCTEEVVDEAIEKGCNLIIAHHPIVFSGLKSLTGKSYIERTVIKAIKYDIAIFAMHTNLDHVSTGVNYKFGQKLGLENLKVLSPKTGILNKLYTYVPIAEAEKVRTALFEAGAGNIGKYEECSFNAEGNGTFKAKADAQPFVGKIGKRQIESEIKLEVLFESHLKGKILNSLNTAHPYEEVAYEIVKLENQHQEIGSGMIGQIPTSMSEDQFLKHVAKMMKCSVIRHTKKLGKEIKTAAICGGAGQFLLRSAIAAKADVFITGDFKYHEFFDAENNIMIMDIGHFESEQFTAELIIEYLQEKFPTFAVLLSGVKTNPVHYFIS
ncbi:MAG: Nif3-like dinuclear metal center hexameric protein [Salibacteraceae bacterium]|nr:Nif3-like dinuclear metal center hexameric protein [Salibacteraceae bacterium]